MWGEKMRCAATARSCAASAPASSRAASSARSFSFSSTSSFCTASRFAASAARRRVSLQQHFIVSLQEKEVGRDTGSPDVIDKRGQSLQIWASVSCIDANGDTRHRIVVRFLQFVEKRTKQASWHIVDAVITQILQCV